MALANAVAEAAVAVLRYRLRTRLRSHCDDSHQPWPAKGRQTRYRDGADDRSRRFIDDLLSSRAGVRRTTAQLALIDLTTGEITT